MKTKNLLKKAFLLLALMGGASSAWADTTYKITYNGSDAGNTTYFSHSGNHNFNTKFKDCTYDGTNFTSGLKMESSSTITFTNTNTATVTVVQSTWSAKGIKFDNTSIANSTASTATTGAYIYTISNVAAGSHTIVRDGGELGIFQVTVVEAAGTKPTITTQPASAIYAVGDTPSDLFVAATASSGELSYQWYKNTDQDKTAKEGDKIVGATSATLDKANISTASENTTYYYVVVTDGNGSTTSNLATITVAEQEQYATPTITEKSGTVQITSSDDITVSQIKYSLDGGESWNTYSIPFNLATATTVKAKVVQGEDPHYTDSEVASMACNAIPAAIAGSLSITLYNDDSNWTKTASQEGSSTKDTWTGIAATYLDGYIIALDNEGQTGGNIKELAYGNAINSKSTLKGSNGRRIKFTIPEGIKVNRITIYSYTNGDNENKYATTWSFNGETADMIGLSLRDIDANNGKSESSNSNPDVRVFSFATPLEGSFYLNNSGYQQCFYMVLDYTPTSVSKTITSAGWATYCSPYALDLANATGLTDAYIITGATGSVLSTTSVKDGTIPANTGILIEAPVGTVTIPVVASSSTDVSTNKLVGVLENTEKAAESIYVLMDETAGVGFYKNNNAFTVGANTAYLNANFAGGSSPARSSYFFRGDTGVDNVEAAAEAKAQDGKFIENGKLVIVKNGVKYNAAGAKLY